MANSYQSVYDQWKHAPEEFWAKAAEKVEWSKPFDKAFDPDAGIYGRWYAGGECNTCYNTVDRQIAEGRGEQDAIIYDSPMTDSQRKFTYNDVLTEVSAMAYILADHGVGKGDRVITTQNQKPLSQHHAV